MYLSLKQVDQQQVALCRAQEAPDLLFAVALPFRQRELGASQRLRLLFSSRDVPHPRLATAVYRHQRVVISEFHARDGVTAQARSVSAMISVPQSKFCRISIANTVYLPTPLKRSKVAAGSRQ